MKDDIFNKISPDEALEILRQITKTDKKLKRRIVDLGLAQKQLNILASQLQAIFGRYSFAKSSK